MGPYEPFFDEIPKVPLDGLVLWAGAGVVLVTAILVFFVWKEKKGSQEKELLIHNFAIWLGVTLLGITGFMVMFVNIAARDAQAKETQDVEVEQQV